MTDTEIFQGTPWAGVKAGGLVGLGVSFAGFGISFLAGGAIWAVAVAVGAVVASFVGSVWWILGYVLEVSESTITVRSRWSEWHVHVGDISGVHELEMKSLKTIYLSIAPGQDQVVEVHRFGPKAIVATRRIIEVCPDEAIATSLRAKSTARGAMTL